MPPEVVPSQVEADEGPVLNESARALFQPLAFATLSTTNPDGSPQVTMVTAFLDDQGEDPEIVLFHRGWYQKLRNIRRVPQVALTIVPSAGALPRYPPRYLVVHGIARVEEGDAAPWSDRSLAELADCMPPGTTLSSAYMPPNGGWTTHITPTRVGGLGPWAKMMRPPESAMRRA